MSGPFKILLIEDNPADARLIREMLTEEEGNRFDLVVAEELSGGLDALRDGIHVVLLDLSLPDSRGIDTFFRVHEKASDVPIILLTGLEDEALALRAIREGAQDYLIKGQVDGILMRSIRYAIERKRLLNERDRLIGELDAALKEVRVLAEKLQKSNRELEEFAAVAAHDLKSPLLVVSMYLRFLERRYGDCLDSNATEYIQIISDSTKRMGDLIDNLLKYSRLDAEMPRNLLDSETALGRALENLKVRIAEARATVTHDPLPGVVCNETRLSQLFQNLIENAIKFRGEEPPHVHVSADRGDREWCFSVRDNGIGIAPELRERIFDAFQRLHESEYPGTGLGLAICRKIAEKWGGRTWFESEPGKGSTFYFTVPDEEGRDEQTD